MTTRHQVDSKVRELFAASLGRPVPAGSELTQATESAWDSMKHVEIMLIIEEAFQITLGPDDFTEMTSLEECVRRIAARLGAA